MQPHTQVEALRYATLHRFSGAQPGYGVTYSIGCFRPSVFSAYDTWF